MNELVKDPTHCPECGKDLEEHPLAAALSCFVHGDYISNGSGSWIWESFKEKRLA